MNDKQGKVCKTPSEIPDTDHFVIIREGNYTEYSGYEETHGVNSPSSYCIYEVFTDQESWEKAIAFYILNKKVDFKALRVSVAQVKTHISVEIKV